MSFKWETPATKYPIYSITKFMSNIFADTTLILTSHFKRRLKNHRL